MPGGAGHSNATKRYIIVDVLGNLLHAQVHAANISDIKAACNVFERASEKYPSIEAYSGDAGYRGTAVTFVKEALYFNEN